MRRDGDRGAVLELATFEAGWECGFSLPYCPVCAFSVFTRSLLLVPSFFLQPAENSVTGWRFLLSSAVETLGKGSRRSCLGEQLSGCQRPARMAGTHSLAGVSRS